MAKHLTESDVRRIAKEEITMALKGIKKLEKEMKSIAKASQKNRQILERLERLLLGEVGVNESDTLKSRANFAYMYAKANTDAKIIERAMPAIKWYEDMVEVEPGCDESKLQTLGKMINLYLNLKWGFAIIGITTVINAIPIIQQILSWLEKNV